MVHHVAADNTIPQADATQLQTQFDATTRQEEERSNDVSIPEFQPDAPTVQQVDKDASATTFNVALQNVENEIPQDWLPHTSIHVLEKVTEVEQNQFETHEGVHEISLAAIPQPSFVEHDVVHSHNDSDIVVTDLEQIAPLDNQSVSHTTKSNASNETEVEIMNDNTVRVTPPQHREVHISKNV